VLFTQPAFAVFFPVVVAAYLLLGRGGQNGLLLVASAVFYGWEHPWWVALLYFSAGIDYAAALGMERWPARRGALLTLSLSVNLLLLGWFKYAAFAAENLRALGAPVPALEVLLPAGISFYTFQSMAYTVDVYRGRLPACRSLRDYFVFVSFFPQLVAGPIERAPDLLAQVQTPRTVTAAGLGAGLRRMAWGLLLKCMVADTVALYVDRLFGLARPSLLLTLAGAFAFSVQILADFGGYSEIARGAAQCLGFRLSPNFLHPYLAANPTEFWRRWHVTFSSWIRDYLYVPLGGSRGSPVRVAAVTVLTFALSGLWHGASWNFVAWGVYHGLLVLAYRRAAPLVERLPRVVSVPIFFGFTVVGWAIFRQHDGAALRAAVTGPVTADGAGEGVVAAVVVAVGAAGGAVLTAGLLVERYVVPRLGALRPALSFGFVSLAATLLFFWTRTNADAFIYFRF
jgi:D-alanyl-lipoteichoic acid acyltransferase DltB (MBOAT superfamily)